MGVGKVAVGGMKEERCMHLLAYQWNRTDLGKCTQSGRRNIRKQGNTSVLDRELSSSGARR